jgi:cyanate permease
MLVYMQIPLLPHQLMDEKLSPLMTGCVMGVFSLGIFVLGGFGSYWVQKYRRNRVCLRAILILLLSLVGLLLIPDLE